MVIGAHLSIEAKAKIKKAWSCALVGALIAGCGGGNGGIDASSSTSSNPPLPVTQELSAYIGTWIGECQFNEVETIVVTRTPGTTDSIDVASKVDLFAAADCTGPLLAKSTTTAPLTSKFVAAVDSAVAFPPASAGVITKIDQVTSSMPQLNIVFTGPGVVHTVSAGIPQQCVDFGDGGSTCVPEGLLPAKSGIEEALLLQGSTFYVLVPSGSGYTVDLKFTKKTN